MIEDDGFLALGDQALVQDVEHLEERRLVGDLVDDVGVEVTAVVRPGLAPDLEGEVLEGVAHL